VVVKKERTLTLMSQGKILNTYKIALGGEPAGPKTRQGDHKTPEGVYVLDRRNAHSQFYRAIQVSYPNAQDRARAKKLGVSAGATSTCMGFPTEELLRTFRFYQLKRILTSDARASPPLLSGRMINSSTPTSTRFTA
jgi:hypothetical protein